MLIWESLKAPGDIEDYDIDWSISLGTDTISTSVWSIIGGDAPASGTLSIVSTDHSATATKVFLAAGNIGVTYTLQNTIVTVSGETVVESAQLQIPASVPQPGDIVPLATAARWMGVTDDSDGSIAGLITEVSSLITNFLNFNPAKQTYTRTFDGQGTSKFFVPDNPLVAVSSVIVDGMAIPMGAAPGARPTPGFYFNRYSVSLHGYCFSRGFQNVTMTYDAGFDPIPGDIQRACLDWMKMIRASGQVPFGSNLVSFAAGDTSVSFGGSGSITDPKKIPLPASIYVALKGYQRVIPVSGW